MHPLALSALTEITRGISLGLALSGNQCPPCAPILNCPDVPRCSDCICQGVERVSPSVGCDCSTDRGYLLIILLLVGLSCGAIGYCLGLQGRSSGGDAKRLRDLAPLFRKGKGAGTWLDGGSGGRSSSSGAGSAAVGE